MSTTDVLAHSPLLDAELNLSRIIANDGLTADTSILIAAQLARAKDTLDQVDFTPSALCVDDNERRWRAFRDRVAAVVRSGESSDDSVGSPT